MEPVLMLINSVSSRAMNGDGVSQLPPSDAMCYAWDEDLKLRGFAEHELREQVQVADYAQLVTLFDQHTRVIGAL